MRSTRLFVASLVWAGLFAVEASALPSDGQLDSLVFAAINADRAQRFGERDAAEARLERMVAQRLQADSATTSAQKRLDQILRLRALRQARSATPSPASPPPVPSRSPRSAIPAPETRPVPVAITPAPQPPLPPSAATVLRCAQGDPEASWIAPTQKRAIAVPGQPISLHLRIQAPCGLRNFTLLADGVPVRELAPVADGLEEREEVFQPAGHPTSLTLRACDPFGHCVESVPLALRAPRPVPPWLLMAVAALFALSVAIGAGLLLSRRRPPSRPRRGGLPPAPIVPQQPTGSRASASPLASTAPPPRSPATGMRPVPPPPPIPPSGPIPVAAPLRELDLRPASDPFAPGSSANGLPDTRAMPLADLMDPSAHETQRIPRTAVLEPEPEPERVSIHDILQAAAREARAREGADLARMALRMPKDHPEVACAATSLQTAIADLLRFSSRRAGPSGAVLLAVGRGPLSMEIVFEDNGPDPEEAALRDLFRLDAPQDRTRFGLDAELREAVELFASLGGTLSGEARIDGGLRVRARLPLASGSRP